MKRWLRRGLIAVTLIGFVYGGFFEAVTHVGRGWLNREPFYDGRPASYWACEIERWETQDPEWRGHRTYAHRSRYPRWIQRWLPEAQWPRLLDGDAHGLAVLQALSKHPSKDVQDWARIGIERIDSGEQGPYKTTPLDVIFTADLYEVDEAFYNRAAKGRWYSRAEMEEMERIFLDPSQKKPVGPSLSDLLDQQALVKSVTDKKIKESTEELLLASTKVTICLPSPFQLRKGNKDAQEIEEGLSVRIHVHITGDRRFAQVKLIEKTVKLEGIDPVAVLLDNNGTEGKAEEAFVTESVYSVPRTIPDGGTIFLALQHRSATAKDKGRWLVLRVHARIYIEEEERQIRKAEGK